jgi:hypothetical protein
MITVITSSRTTHKSETTFPKCDTCGTAATHGVQDCNEILTTDPEGYREFELISQIRRGCASHSVVSYTTYLDGRKLHTDACVPERVQCQ